MTDLFSRAAPAPQPAQPKPVKPVRYGRDNPRPLSAGVGRDVAKRCTAPGCGAWASFGVKPSDDVAATHWCGRHAPDAVWAHVPGGRPAFLQGGGA